MIGALENLAYIFHVFNVITGIFGTIAFLTNLYLHYDALMVLPKNLRVYTLVFCIPVGILLSVVCTAVSLHQIIILTNANLINAILRWSTVLLSQQLRLSFLIIVVERMAATIWRGKYENYSSHWGFFAITFFVSVVAQIPCSFPAFFWMFLDFNQYRFYYIIWTAFIMHFITLVTCKILYIKNKQMYKLLAYQTTLKQRHQIVENVKVLAHLWPIIFIFSVICPIGPALCLIYTLFTGAVSPFGLFHCTYNIAPIVLALYFKVKSYKNNRIQSLHTREKQGSTVVSPLGTQLPTHVSMENYFQNLQEQWK